MSKQPPGQKAAAKDMYWFAHGGIETTDKNNSQNIPGDTEEDSSNDSLTYRPVADQRGQGEEIKPVSHTRDFSSPNSALNLGHSSNSSQEREARPRSGNFDSRKIAVDDRKKQLWEAEQERNDALLKKHMEREAALEARRNAQRSNIAFAFGSSLPRNLESNIEIDKPSRFPTVLVHSAPKSDESYEIYRAIELHSSSPLSSNGTYCLTGNSLVDGDSPRSPFALSNSSYHERKTMSPPCWLVGSGALIGEDLMTRSMTASMYAPIGRRKNDLTPTVPHEKSERTGPPRKATSSLNRKRSVSMTRLDQLAQPRKHYLEANKANSTASNGASCMPKDASKNPARPLSSASEKTGHPSNYSAVRRVRSSPKKPRPVTIAGSAPDQGFSFEVKVSPIKKSYAPSKRPSPAPVTKKVETANVRSAQSKTVNPPKTTTRSNMEKPAAPKPSTVRQPLPKKPVAKQASAPKTSTPKTSTPKTPIVKKSSPTRKLDSKASSPAATEATVEMAKPTLSPARSPSPDSEVNSEMDKNNSKRIISEEEAKAALAEKRRLAREQAEKEAELERQRQETLRLEEEKRLREEEEEQKKMEEEQLKLLDEHRKQEEEKLKKAIEEREQKEEEEKFKREEELRMKNEQEKKAKEEAERQKIELEEKLRKEEEERAERKKRLEKIMSRTRGKTSGTSPSGSISGSDQLDSGDNPHEIDSSGANSLESEPAGDTNEALPLDDDIIKTDQSASIGDSVEANPTYEIDSENESTNVSEAMQLSEHDNSLIGIPEVQTIDESSVHEKISVSDNEIHDVQAAKSEDHKVVEQDQFFSTDIQKPDVDNELFHGKELSQFDVSDQKCDISLKPENAQSHVTESGDLNKEAVNILPDPVLNEVFGEGKQDVESFKHEDELLRNAEAYPTESSNFMASFSDQTSEMKVEQRSRDSTSSDLKLPDPIYEMTSSDEGSISSDKLQKYAAYEKNEFNNYPFTDGESTGYNMGGTHSADDVFPEHEVDDAKLISEKFSNRFETESSHYNASIFDGSANVNQEKDWASNEDALSLVKGVNSTKVDIQVQQLAAVESTSDNNTNSTDPMLPKEIANDFNASALATPAFTNPFSTEDPHDLNSSMHPLENQSFASESVTVPLDFQSSDINLDNKFQNKDSEFDQFVVQATVDSDVLQNPISFPGEKSGSEKQTISDKLNSGQVGDLTLITDSDTGDCIGLISTAEEVQTVPSAYPISPFNNNLNNMYDNVRATDSEDSSLDSNLSQVIDVNNDETETSNGLNSNEMSNKSGDCVPNFEYAEHPFPQTSPVSNGSISTTNGKHLSGEKVTNGHRNPSSGDSASLIEEFPNYTQLDRVKGKDISSVDQPKDNIFENVDAFDFSKGSSDPFLAKGSTNQVSGNPFLM